MKKTNNFYTKVYEITKKVPRGKVTTYGTIACILGKPRAARAVGYALNNLEKSSDSSIPWHRVINFKGKISFKGDTYRAELQKKLLLEEKIIFGANDAIDLVKYGWEGF